jgi:dolichol-phosphate mannosyltransferase
VAASSVGMAVNYGVALYVRTYLVEDMAFGLQIAAMIGVAAGMAFNFLGNRYVVFRKRFVRKG